jgi:zinc protease
VASLTGMLLDKGTTRQDKFAIAKQLDDVGAQIGFSVGEQTVGIAAKTLKADLPLVIRILAEQLRTPAFAADEFEKAKKQFEGALRPALEDTKFRAHDAFTRQVYPPGHPNRMEEVPQWLSASQRLTLDEVKAFHRKYYGPARLRLVFVGDVDARRIQTEVRKAFAGWTGGVDVVRSFEGRPVQSKPEERVVLQDKTSVSLMFGQPTGLRFQDADAIALRVGTAILGSGFTGRLMSTVRDKEGLTYGISAGLNGDTFVDGDWSVTAAFAPALLDKGIASMRREVENWWQNGVTAEELAARKTNLIGTYHVGLATTEGMARSILQTLNRDKPLRWLDDYPAEIEALTVGQVNAAIKKYLDPSKMVLVAAGTFETKAEQANTGQ